MQDTTETDMSVEVLDKVVGRVEGDSGSLLWAAARGREDLLERILLQEHPPPTLVLFASSPDKEPQDYSRRPLRPPPPPPPPPATPPPGLNNRDSTGRTTASYLAGNGAVELLEVLIQYPDLDINLPDNEGNTPLHFAAQAGQVETVNLLLTQCPRIEIDVRNNLGFTALMKAAIQGRTKCAKLLLTAGASPTLRDGGRGFRAEEWARFCGRYGTAEAIEKCARGRLMERGGNGSGGRWGSDPQLGPHVVNGVLRPPAVTLVQQLQNQHHASKGLASRLKRALKGPSSGIHHSPSYSLVTHITSAAFCASSPALPGAGQGVPPIVKSLIRPLQVPKVQVTTPTEAQATPTAQTTSPTKAKKKK